MGQYFLDTQYIMYDRRVLDLQEFWDSVYAKE